MLLGLDLGTGSCKALLLEPGGTVLGEASRQYQVHAKQVGWAETDPRAWWDAILEAAKEAIGKYSAEVRAIGLSGQMHGTVLTDKTGAATRAAILWSDTRSSTVLERFSSLTQKQLERLANPIVAGVLGSTLLWLAQEQQLKTATYALLPKDWLRLQLTGEVGTEPSDASATLLYDLVQDTWAWDILETLELPQILPPLVASAQVAGTLTRAAAEALGVKTGIPVVAGGGDTPCAMLGNGMLETGVAQLSVGTGAQIVVPQNTVQTPLNTHCYRTVLQDTPKYYAMSAMQNAGLALERVRSWLGLGWLEFYDLAFSLTQTQDLIFLPYISGERTPHLNPVMRGAFLNLGLQHTQAHLARAALLGVALSIKDGLDALPKIQSLRLVGGGSLEPRWQQLLCDVLEVPLEKSGAANASARGAALLAGLAIGIYQNAFETRQHLPKPQVIATPTPKYSQARAQFRAAAQRSLP